MILNYRLRSHHIKEYKKNGYIICRNFFKAKTFKKILNAVNQIEKYKNAKNKWMKYYDMSLKNKKKKILTRIENFIDYQKDFKKIFSNPSFKYQLKKIAGYKVVLFKDKINFKNPGGQGFKPHQDATIWRNMYNIKSFFSFALAIDDSTVKNGCLEFSKFNKKKLLSKPWKEIDKKVEKKLAWETVEMKAGDVVIFNDYSPHRSSDNLSNKKRRMLFFTYNSKKYGDHRQRHFDDKRKNFPPNIERKKGAKYVYHV
jgi:ectoine hydroxylase-related dioxygenase (phytanoyl-CoA dioxygenase family)